MSRQKELYEIALVVHHETDRAYRVSESGRDDDAVWIPKSACEIGEKKGTHQFWPIHEFTVETWIAKERGLI